MSHLYRLLSLLFLLFPVSIRLPGQEINLRSEQQMEELAERMAVTEDASAESSLLLDDLSRFAVRPLEINTATEEELLSLNLLNFSQVQCLLTYRKKYGNILTVHELSLLEDFDEEVLNKIIPFVNFRVFPDSLSLHRSNSWRHSLLARVKTTYPAAAGYASVDGKPRAYSGSPYSYYTRYRGELGQRIEFGMTGENDAGEDFFQDSNKSSFDFLSGYVAWHGKGVLQKVVAGDYHLRFGQGINLWSGGGVSYASDIFSLMRSGEGIRPYSSTDENLFFRGAAVKLAIRLIQFSLFCSGKSRDANLNSEWPGQTFITSFRMDGLHRTPSELSDEKNTGEKLAGGYCDIRFDKGRIGLLTSCRQFEFPVVKGELPYKSHSFEGDVSYNFGMDYQFIFKRMSLFGEAGMTRDLRPAILNGLLWKAHPRFSLSLLLRYYDPAFQSFSSSAFAEGSECRNEKGFFASCEFYPVPGMKVSGHSDLFQFPWLTYRTYSPSLGYNLSFRVDITLHRNSTLYIYSKYLQKPSRTTGFTGVPGQWDERTSKWRIHGDFGISERIRLRSRVEISSYRFNGIREMGYLVYQDMIFSPARLLKCWLRLSFYNTDGYDSRIYCYENDLLYYFAIPEFHGAGIRSYLNLKLEPLTGFSIYAKTGCTLRSGATSIGSGNDETPGNHRWDARIQVALKF